MPTRATKLASLIPAANTQTSAFTVPAGQTWLVKSALVLNPNANPDHEECWLQDAAGAKAWLIFSAANPQNVRIDWEGIVAAVPGDQLFVYSNLGAVPFWITGTKLPGVA